MNPKTILVVEDETVIRENIAEILAMKGFSVILATNGSVGLRLAIEQPPDLIVSDITMPVMNGMDLLKNVRFNKEICNTPFLFLTSNTQYSDWRQGMELGADDYLFKPFSIDQLLNAINTRLEKHRKIQDELNQKVEWIIKQSNNTLSHEYHTPLNGILGFTNLILSNYDFFSSSQIKEFLAMIEVSGNRLKKTIDKTVLFRELISLSPDERQRLAEKKTEYKIKQHDIENLVRDISKKANKPTTLNMDIDPATIYLDENNAAAIFTELIENAVNFSDTNTTIAVTGHVENASYIFTVYNRGRGFRPEDIEKIGPFIQFERARFEQQGSGLGLYNVSSICNLYGIGFAVESKYGEYAKITISFNIE